MKTTHPTPFIQVEHDEFEEKTRIRLRYENRGTFGMGKLVLPIIYESSKDGESWLYYYHVGDNSAFPDKIILRCDSNNVILENPECDFANRDCYFKISNTDAKRIAESTNVDARIYCGKDSHILSATTGSLIRQNPHIFAVQNIFNYLDNNLYADKVNEYTQYYKNNLKQAQTQQQAEQQLKQSRQTSPELALLMLAMAFVGGFVAFIGFFLAGIDKVSWLVPILGAIACVVGFAKFISAD